MSGVKLTGDWSKLESDLHSLSKVNFTALHKEIGEYLVSSTKERFDNETAPDGTEWPKSYRVQEEGGVTMTDTARLKNSVHYRARPDKVEVGTNDIRASVHQQGKTIKAKNAKFLKFKVAGRWAQKKSVKIPARPFIGISEEDDQEIVAIIAETFGRLLK